MSRETTLQALFAQKIDRRGADECWPWKAGTNGAGYGVYQVAGVRLYAHRQSYIEAWDDIPAGMVVRHKCDNPICCNPHHLEVGTMADNSQDAVRRGRFASRECPRGEEHGMAKVSPAVVVEMRNRFDADRRGDTTRAAEAYGISHSQASRILRRQAWAHL